MTPINITIAFDTVDDVVDRFKSNTKSFSDSSCETVDSFIDMRINTLIDSNVDMWDMYKTYLNHLVHMPFVNNCALLDKLQFDMHMQINGYRTGYDGADLPYWKDVEITLMLPTDMPIT